MKSCQIPTKSQNDQHAGSDFAVVVFQKKKKKIWKHRSLCEVFQILNVADNLKIISSIKQ